MELINKLLESNSYKSNELEQRVANILAEYDWSVHRSLYYKDPKTLKFRELDIKGSYRYTTDIKNTHKDYHIIEYDLIIECKTLNGYHALFDGIPSIGGRRVNNYNIWSGYESYDYYDRSKKILSDVGVNLAFVPKILENLSQLHFPDNSSVISDYCISPPSIPSFCSFRETNIGTEKELDNSVIWKAFQEFQSVIKSEEIENYENIESDVLGYFRYSGINLDQVDIVSFCEQAFKQNGKIKNLKVIHPVLVVNCDLWDISNSNPKSLPFCRLLINSMSGNNMFWFDVVNIQHMRIS